MNWTGGRLQRHSNNRSSNLAINQKQNFAKSRLRSTKDSRQAPSLIEFATFRTSQQARSTEDEAQRHGLADKPTVNPSLSRLTRDSSIGSEQKKNSQPPDRIEDIKRQLLQTTDWAAVGAARPLKVSFTPVEEVEHFGKRRRLTEADRTRLATMEHRAMPPEFTKTRNTGQNMSSDLPGIEGLEIKINGRRCHADRGVPKERHENFSSQPMLLDRDVSVWADQGSDPSVHPYSDSNARSAREDSVDRSLYRQRDAGDPKSSIPSVISPRSRLSQSIITNPITSSRNASGLIQTPEFLGQDFEASMSTPLRYHDSNGFNSSSGSIIQNRFTIDDQIAAEEERCSNIGTIVRPFPVRHRGPQIEPSPFSRSSKYPLSLDQSFGHREHEQAGAATQSPSGWLPEPRCNIRRLLSQKPESLHPFGSIIQETPRRNSRIGQNTPPIKIFGQPIDIAADQASNGTTTWMSTPWNSAVNRPGITSLTEDSHATSIYQFASQSPDNRADTQGSSRLSHTSIVDDPRDNIIDRIYTGTPIFSNSNPVSVRSFSAARSDRSSTPTTSRRYSEVEGCTTEHNEHGAQIEPSPKIYGQEMTDSVVQSLLHSSSPDPLSHGDLGYISQTKW